MRILRSYEFNYLIKDDPVFSLLIFQGHEIKKLFSRILLFLLYK